MVYSEKPLPHSLEAEEAVLGAVLVGDEVLPEIATLLNTADFFRDRNREVYAAMLRLFRRGERVTLVTVAHELKRRQSEITIEYLRHLYESVPTPMDGPPSARIVAQMARWRDVVRVGSDLCAKGYEAKGDPGAAVSEALGSLMTLAGDGQQRRLIPASDIAFAALEEWHALKDPETAENPPVPTGLHDLDLKLLGGLRRSEVTIITGLTSMGKTTLSRVIAWSLAERGYPVLYITLEEPHSQLGFKQALGEARVNNAEIMRRIPRKVTDEEDEAMQRQIDAMSRRPLVAVDHARVTVADVNAHILAAKSQFPDLFAVFVDHMGHLVDRYGNSERERMNFISRSLLDMSRQHKVAMIPLCQLNRESAKRGDKRPQLTDLKESGNIEQDATVVLALFRQDYFTKEREAFASDEERARFKVKPELEGKVEVWVLKSRNGQTGLSVFEWWHGKAIDPVRKPATNGARR